MPQSHYLHFGQVMLPIVYFLSTESTATRSTEITQLIFLCIGGWFFTYSVFNPAQAVLMTGTIADKTASSVSGLLSPVETKIALPNNYKHRISVKNTVDKSESLLCRTAFRTNPKSRGIMMSLKNWPISSVSRVCCAIFSKLMHTEITSSTEKPQLPKR